MLGRESIRPYEIVIEHSFDMQFAGQTLLIRVPFKGRVTALEDIRTLFEEAYFARFRLRLPEVHAVIFNVNTSVIGIRDVWFADAWHETPIYRREKLPLTAVIEGPAILEQFDCTTVVPPGVSAAGDDQGNIILAIAGARHDGN
ncbi:hypothetical protein [Martelella sp. AMO21009]